MPKDIDGTKLRDLIKGKRTWLRRHQGRIADLTEADVAALLKKARKHRADVGDLLAQQEELRGRPSKSELLDRYDEFITALEQKATAPGGSGTDRSHDQGDDYVGADPVPDEHPPGQQAPDEGPATAPEGCETESRDATDGRPTTSSAEPAEAATDGETPHSCGYERRTVAVANLVPNAFNRTIFVDSFEEEALEPLAADVAAKGGLVYPIHVAADGVTIIDGERRYRTLLAEGVEEVDVVVHHDIVTADQIEEYVLTDHGTHRRTTVREQVHLFEAWHKRLQKKHGRPAGRPKSNSSRSENHFWSAEKVRGEAARRAGFASYASANKAQKVLDEADEATVAMLLDGELSVSGAYQRFLDLRRIKKEGSPEMWADVQAGVMEISTALVILDVGDDSGDDNVGGDTHDASDDDSEDDDNDTGGGEDEDDPDDETDDGEDNDDGEDDDTGDGADDNGADTGGDDTGHGGEDDTGSDTGDDDDDLFGPATPFAPVDPGGDDTGNGGEDDGEDDTGSQPETSTDAAYDRFQELLNGLCEYIVSAASLDARQLVKTAIHQLDSLSA